MIIFLILLVRRQTQRMPEPHETKIKRTKKREMRNFRSIIIRRLQGEEENDDLKGESETRIRHFENEQTLTW